MKSRTLKAGPGNPGKMERLERELLLALAEEVVLQLRTRLMEMETQHPLESAILIAGFQERLWCIEDLTDQIRSEARKEANP